MKALHIKIYFFVCLTFYGCKKYGNSGFVTAGNTYLLFYCLHHKIMLFQVPKDKFFKIKLKIM
jgi:hypothetical protein